MMLPTTTTTKIMPLKLKLSFGSLFVWHTFMCLIWIFTSVFFFTAYYYGPDILRINTEWQRGEFLESCPLTTDNIDDLIVNERNSNDYNIQQLDRNGVSIVPNVLKEDTVTQLREYVDKANKEMHQVFVLEEDNRYRIMPTPFDVPIVAKAMGEIALHDKLRPLIDGALGPYASLVAFSFITSKYGALAQEWHQDTVISAMTHPNDFVHEYTLTIPLQRTTKGMGATQLCPGTHGCYWLDYDRDQAMIDNGWTLPSDKKNPMMSQQEGEDYVDDFDYEFLPCSNITANLNPGDALIYHTDLIHRGGEFYDNTQQDNDRIILFVTFAESKEVSDMSWLTLFDYKSLPFGKVHSLDWKMWGLTIDDFPNLIHLHENSWLGKKYQNFKSIFYGPVFGYNTGSSSSERLLMRRRPWTAIDAFMMIFNEPDGKCYYIHNEFDAKEAKKVASKFVYYCLILTFIYFWIGIPLWIYTILGVFKGKDDQQQEQEPNGNSATSHHQNGNSTHSSNGLHHAKVE